MYCKSKYIDSYNYSRYVMLSTNFGKITNSYPIKIKKKFTTFYDKTIVVVLEIKIFRQ